MSALCLGAGAVMTGWLLTAVISGWEYFTLLSTKVGSGLSGVERVKRGEISGISTLAGVEVAIGVFISLGISLEG